MRLHTVILVLFSILYAVHSQSVNCFNTPATTMNQNSSGNTGCCSFGSSVRFYTPDGGVPCFFSGTRWNPPYTSTVTFQSNGDTVRVDRNTNSSRVGIVNGYMQITSSSTYSNCISSYGVYYDFVCLSYFNFSAITLAHNRTVMFTNTTSKGGFAFFILPPYATQLGTQLEAYVNVYDYRGLKPPGVFISRDYFPRLEFYDYTNVTTTNNFAKVFQYTLPNPRSGRWYLGMYFYGYYSQFTVKMSWRYSVDVWAEDVTITGATSSVKCGQFYVPLGSSAITVEAAREQPGGYPAVYIQQGLLPDEQSYDYVFDLKQSDYQKLEIPNPSPINPNPNVNNPGMWFVCVFKQTPIDQEGFVFRWNSYF